MIRIAYSVLAYATLILLNLSTAPAAAQTLVNTAATTGTGRRDGELDLAPVTAEGVVPERLAVMQRVDSTVGGRRVRELWGELERFARLQRTEFDSAVVLYQSSPSAVRRLAEREGETAAQAVIFAVLANDREQFSQHLQTLKLPADRLAVTQYAASLRESLDAAWQRLGSPVVSLFAEGNVRAAATGDGENEPTGTGALALSLSTRRYSLYGSVNVASSHDALVSGHGAAILTPATGKPLTSGLLQGRLEPATRMRWWGSIVPNAFYVSVAKSVWSRDTTAAQSVPDAGTIEANTIGAAIFRSWDAISGWVGQSPVAFTVHWGGAIRWLTGDIADEVAIRSAPTVLGTDKRTFYGPEVGMQISFNRITAALQLYYLFPDKQHVDGLTGGQIAAGVGVVGEIVRDVLRRR